MLSRAGLTRLGGVDPLVSADLGDQYDPTSDVDPSPTVAWRASMNWAEFPS